MRIALWVLGLIAAAALGFYAYMGGFHTVTVTKGRIGPMEFVYAPHRGSYAKLNETWGAFMPKWQEAGLGTCLTMGVYLDLPGTPEEKLRSLIGCRIDGWGEAQRQAARAKFPTLIIPESEAVLSSFPFRNVLSFFYAPTRVYPVINAELAARGVKPSIGIEQYGSFDAIEEISFAVPVTSDPAPYQPLYEVFAQ